MFRASLTAALLLASTASAYSPSTPDSVELGLVRLSKYTHNEGGRLTRSGYVLKDSDREQVCAVSQDLWNKKVFPGDRVLIERFGVDCEVLDTMAIRNSKGFKQRHWIDVYQPSHKIAWDFGIRKARAIVVRRSSLRNFLRRSNVR